MYKNIRSRIVYNNAASDFFDCNNGVRQLENPSPFLFSMYLNDLEQFLNDRNVNGLTSITEDFESELDIYLKLFVLLYADDTSKSFKYIEKRKGERFSNCRTPLLQSKKSVTALLYAILDFIF
jgi:hypothetical protein